MPEQGPKPYDWAEDENRATSEQLEFGPPAPVSEPVLDIREQQLTLEHAMAELDAIVASAKLESQGELFGSHLDQIEQTAMERSSTPSTIRRLTLEYLNYIKKVYEEEYKSKRYMHASARRPFEASIRKIDERIAKVEGS